ncbi:MAG: ATP-dependent DNA helicase RecG [Dehalococcoidia bacterium]|nr:ATP-dependent DNA helicase RecG [Dehalococcoidia bacterium]
MTGATSVDSPPWLPSLRRILLLEQERGYDDRAVIGGLDGFLRRNIPPATQNIARPALLRRFKELGLSVPRYAGRNPSERAQWVAGVLAFLDEVECAGVHTPASSPVAVRHPAPPASRTYGRAVPRVPVQGVNLDSSLGQLKAASPSVLSRLEKLGVSTVRDLLYFFPRRHLDYSQMNPVSQLEIGQEQTVIALVWEARQSVLGGRRGTEAVLGDETGNVRAVWFNQPYLAKRLSTNSRVVLSGRVGLFKGQKVFESPAWEPYEEAETIHTGRLVPVYPLTEGLYPKAVRRLTKAAVDSWAGLLTEFLPPRLLHACDLAGLAQAVRQAHFPGDLETKGQAVRRLAFDELFLLQMAVFSRKRQWQQAQPGRALPPRPEAVEGFLSSLPFTLTPAQQRALDEVLKDLARPQAMARLVQGEVGSGKTVVAVAALVAAVAAGFQGAFMAPTEILAEQHYRTLSTLFGAGNGRENITVALLTGGRRTGEKAELYRKVAAGEVDIVVGTHALIQKEVAFHRLGLVVVDEQHRFGVLQRSALREKGYHPHVLVMTATPIPRTLALTLYGDLDLSVIDQLPPGRQRIQTNWVEPRKRDAAYGFVRRQVAEGRQAFIMCPLVEESDVIATRAAVAEYQRLSRDVFPSLRLGLIHGRLRSSEKESVMHHFREGELDVLVSTPVVEVGIDIPNATVMLVEGAERFGLSQLHQFRGRVGRGQHASYCILMADEPSPEAQERLKIVAEVHDGFALAEEDLRLRGPGEFFGTRQSGMPDLKMARLTDLPLLELAREHARNIFERDPSLSDTEHKALAAELRRLYGEGGEWS